MYLQRSASRARQREAENARRNRGEIVKALSIGEVSRRELFKWGIFTAGGALAMTNGLSPFAPSKVEAAVPTGAPRSPTFGVQPFTQPLQRLALQTPMPLTPRTRGTEVDLRFPAGSGEPDARRLSWHTDFTATGGTQHVNPLTGRGPMEGRPPGEYFGQQRWREYLPKKAYVMSLGCPPDDTFCFHKDLPHQAENKVWSFGAGRMAEGGAPPLIKVRYGEPVIFRHYNNLPLEEADNGGFGSNSQSTHNHNGHNASTGDGASNAHFFPGQFYDYHWTTTLARADMPTPSVPNVTNAAKRASGPDGKGGLVQVPGDYRELQSTLWFHDHRFFYTAENVYKGHMGMLNYYSGPDRGNEVLSDGVNLRLPSGSLLDWGNIDFDVNLAFSDAVWDQDGQLFFDIFDVQGFVGDQVLVNFAYKPYFEVLPRKYRFRILAAGMARFWRFALVNSANQLVPMKVIATDGNFLPAPVTVTQIDPQGVGERFDVIVDFTGMPVNSKLRLVNLMEHEVGQRPKQTRSVADALSGRVTGDPAVGAALEFRIVSQVASVDVPGVIHRTPTRDLSQVPAKLTDLIPIVEPTRVRVIEFKSGADSPRDPVTGECLPSCPDETIRPEFPYGIRINGEGTYGSVANRVSFLVPKPGEVEHWILRNTAGSWDHPVHLHFEEGRTIDRGATPLSAIERNSRKDVWRLGTNGDVRIQVRFGEYGGAYVMHCHNTAHEDAAMLLRYDILTDPNNPKNSQTHVSVIPTPNPTPDGVTYVTPELLPEGNPFHPDFEPFPSTAPT
ncbi:multicopper oxidase family protein [Rubellimicrobium aerolatum]|uniref:Multicopper oxidase family protein n=1 Tax=Rubellimicrobium aerolatum TaxID=490979 RepID=A0ABW0SCS1_9RHOB|nr:multicopper oxidase domain-containing protein [Rubellimicrobium aerolatum]MBP1806174.1 FtsP/CotA-like multicopper oxidase with cupredoxin domain [Rubellimicrobium aerolatum]